MQKRSVAGRPVSPIGLGAMNLSHGYSRFPGEEEGMALLRDAVDAGVDHIDTATLYGGGRNERLVGLALRDRREAFQLASKGVLEVVDGRSTIDGRPENLKRQVAASLERLGVERIDLYYLHRLDRSVPIEDSVGALAEEVTAGRIGAIGLSEVSAATLRRAHAVHPIAAVQNEYSLWTRNPELGLLQATRELGAAFVAFSPLGRGALAGLVRDVSALPDGDMRHAMPRFDAENYPRNLRLVDGLIGLASAQGLTAAQLALAWVLAQGEHVIAIPGTTSIEHRRENAGGAAEVPAELLLQLDALINQDTVHGARYSAAQQATVDTEEFPAA